jgi:hypothetical protein
MKHGCKVTEHIVVADLTLSVKIRHTKRVELHVTKAGRAILARVTSKSHFHVRLLTTLSGGARSIVSVHLS